MTDMFNGGFGNSENKNNSDKDQYIIQNNGRKLAHVTIKQIITAPLPEPEENVVIDNCDISDLVIVACIKEINITNSYTSLKVNDGTGLIEVKKWHSDVKGITDTSNLMLS